MWQTDNIRWYSLRKRRVFRTHYPCWRTVNTGIGQGSFPVRKRTGTLRIWRSREREPIWGSGGGAPSGVQGQSPWSGGQGAKPLEAEGILLPKRANLSLSFKWNLNFAAICRKGPERRSGNQKKNRNGVPVRSGSKRTLASVLTQHTWVRPMFISTGIILYARDPWAYKMYIGANGVSWTS